MREQEMRMRVFRFLGARMRNMIMPATVGIGLAVGGACTRTEATPVYSAPLRDDAAAVRHDAPGGQEVARQDASSRADVPGDVRAPDLSQPSRDLGDGLDAPTRPDVLADSSPDVFGPEDGRLSSDSAERNDLQSNDAASTEAALRRDSLPDFGGAKYIAPFFDGGPADARADLGGSLPADAPADLGSISVKYLAQLPDAAIDSTPALRYMAQMPDAGPAVALYMAPIPTGT